jgi:hypothetical protein
MRVCYEAGIALNIQMEVIEQRVFVVYSPIAVLQRAHFSFVIVAFCFVLYIYIYIYMDLSLSLSLSLSEIRY